MEKIDNVSAAFVNKGTSEVYLAKDAELDMDAVKNAVSKYKMEVLQSEKMASAAY